MAMAARPGRKHGPFSTMSRLIKRNLHGMEIANASGTIGGTRPVLPSGVSAPRF